MTGSAQLVRAFTAADLVFDPATHTSRLPDGREVPHVTAVLSAVGVGLDFAALSATHPRVAGYVRSARDRGTAVHADCHAYDDDDLDADTVDPRVLPYVEAWAKFRQEKRLAPLSHGRERLVFHAGCHYAGILDGVFQLPDGRLVLADIKTGDPDDAGARWQTAAYEAAWAWEHLDGAHAIAERWAVWLQPKLRVPYRITNYTAEPDAWMHFPQFQAMLTTYALQACRRPKR